MTIGRRTVIVAMAAFLLAACAENPDLALAPQTPPETARSTSTAADELASALDLWKDFPANAEPRPLIILGETRGGGFNSGEAKNAFAYGDWTAPDDLPAAPEEFGGYRVLPAKEALLRLRGEQAPENQKGGGDLEVDEVKLVGADFPTDRGGRRLPAWRVDFVEASQPVFIVAVADSERYAPDPKAIYYPSIGATARPSDTVLRLSPDPPTRLARSAR